MAVSGRRQADRVIVDAGTASVPRRVVDRPTLGILTKTDLAVQGADRPRLRAAAGCAESRPAGLQAVARPSVTSALTFDNL
jgi:hypothetical protein